MQELACNEENRRTKRLTDGFIDSAGWSRLERNHLWAMAEQETAKQTMEKATSQGFGHVKERH